MCVSSGRGPSSPHLFFLAAIGPNDAAARQPKKFLRESEFFLKVGPAVVKECYIFAPR